MKQYDLAEGMRMYIARLREQGRYSSAKSYQDALNSFLRFCGQEVIPYTRIDREMLLRFQQFLEGTGKCLWCDGNGYLVLNPSLFSHDLEGTGCTDRDDQRIAGTPIDQDDANLFEELLFG